MCHKFSPQSNFTDIKPWYQFIIVKIIFIIKHDYKYQNFITLNTHFKVINYISLFAVASIALMGFGDNEAFFTQKNIIIYQVWVNFFDSLWVSKRMEGGGAELSGINLKQYFMKYYFSFSGTYRYAVLITKCAWCVIKWFDFALEYKPNSTIDAIRMYLRKFIRWIKS